MKNGFARKAVRACNHIVTYFFIASEKYLANANAREYSDIWGVR
jgi:hypothetical protein